LIKKIFIIFTCLYSSLAFSEYRVFQYYVRPKIQNLTIVASELVTSTLNPIAYVAYHGGNESIEVNLLRSWQCMGNTSKIPVCTLAESLDLKSSPNLELGVKP
jgi:hypothetical protein